VSEQFAATILRLRGLTAQAWLTHLRDTLIDYARRWALRLGTPFADFSFNYVTRATRADGAPVVLKVGFLDDAALRMEAEALSTLGGRGMIRLLDSDLGSRALLLERIEPGTPCMEIDDDQALYAAGLMQRYWRPAPDQHAFPTVARWGRGFERHRRRFNDNGPIPSPPSGVWKMVRQRVRQQTPSAVRPRFQRSTTGGSDSNERRSTSDLRVGTAASDLSRRDAGAEAVDPRVL
jgi:streptomycin 6-kinase